MVIEDIIAGWNIGKILVDMGSSADILFASIFDQMKLSRNSLQPVDNPLFGFGRKRVQVLGKMPVSFGTMDNARTEQITFDLVDLYYPYYAIFARGIIKKFEAIIHQAYLCMKMPTQNEGHQCIWEPANCEKY